ncbi:hypothetical protein M9Y10_045985 [Tritrichomonas musculus]|uniref:Uncharacterized protein n=1 Tax=Tritrichomonas musculus TaxID=1915356 RepID=A0ABR2JWT9_9EUKA
MNFLMKNNSKKMEELEIENQILLLEAVRRFYPQSENKELVLPMIFQWFNERSTQFVPTTQLDEIVRSLFKVPQKTANIKLPRPFSFRS